MPNRRQAGQDLWDKWERDCQTVIATLDDPAPTASPELVDALASMGNVLKLLAIYFLKRMGIHDPSELAQDAVQTWHIRMLQRGFIQYRRSGNGRTFHPYGRRVLWNICATMLRKKGRGGGDAVPDIRDPRDNPPLAAEQAETREIVSKAIADLSPNIRATMTLTELQGWSSRDAAAELGITEHCVNSRKFRGREQLRRLLSASGLVPQN
eukprot:TRINITY_DN707_c3_g1_i11.p1 TRINITY_DN707_c3_g1~~TRINITY_DN707_c3_g1_i11.p1  ORF type:complete len:210 (+),score=35.76 TRINITY_DN707_c3_g1_i11:617-1246(+)